VSRLDRYLLSQLMALFGFFALVLVSVYWINQAVWLFERLISDGHTASVVLEFTALMLPNVIRLVLPVSAFAAAVYAINRLASESELVVMQATGFSPWRLARPVAMFGLVIGVLLAILVHWLVPAARAQLADREAQLAENVTAQFLIEGAFLHPAPGVTLYIREISARGELLDLFLSDTRDGPQETTYTAQKSFVIRTEAGPKLIMFEGMVQTLRRSDGRLAITRFAEFTYDIGGLFSTGTSRNRRLNEFSTAAIWSPDAALLGETRQSAEQLRYVLHERISQPFLVLIGALIGFAAMVQGGFSRFGLGRQIALAIGMLISVQFVSNLVADYARHSPHIWQLAYLPALYGGAAISVLLWWPSRIRRMPLRHKRRRAIPAEGAR